MFETRNLYFSSFSILSHMFPITKFILSIIITCIWTLSSSSGEGGVLFWSDMIAPAKIS